MTVARSWARTQSMSSLSMISPKPWPSGWRLTCLKPWTASSTCGSVSTRRASRDRWGPAMAARVNGAS
ncbi:hypothetical protein [Caulobacter sp. UC70_42]|uniref:hypothetical protein n=1 Tax=Caulobacter sp. UC70_42 TaxID=3374551 RepID=UPI0037564432